MASEPSGPRKSRCIMCLANYRSLKSPTDSSDEPDLWSGHAPGDGRAGRSLDMVECFLITGPFHGMPLIKKFAKRSIRDLVVAAFAFQQIASSICFYVVSSAFVLARELHLQADNLPPVLLEGPTQKSGRPCAGTRLVCLHVVSNAFWQYLCPRHEQLQS